MQNFLFFMSRACIKQGEMYHSYLLIWLRAIHKREVSKKNINSSLRAIDAF